MRNSYEKPAKFAHQDREFMIRKSIQCLCLFLLSIVSLDSFGQGPLSREKITDDISMKIPSDFIPLVESERNRKFLSAKEPIALYSNSDRTVDLGINETSSRWSINDLVILKDFYKANILSLYTEVAFLQEGIITIDDRSFIAFEFNSKVVDERGLGKPIAKYTYILYTIKEDRVLLFNFSAPFRYRQAWQPAAQEMMSSIRIKN